MTVEVGDQECPVKEAQEAAGYSSTKTWRGRGKVGMPIVEESRSTVGMWTMAATEMEGIEADVEKENHDHATPPATSSSTTTTVGGL